MKIQIKRDKINKNGSVYNLINNRMQIITIARKQNSLRLKGSKQINIEVNNSDDKVYSLIVNADDFGISPERDKGIMELIRIKRVSSVSVLVNGGSIKQSSQHLKSYIYADSSEGQAQDPQIDNNILRRLSVGLHFNLTEGAALSQTVSCQLISQQSRLFRGKQFLYEYIQSLKTQNKGLPLPTKQFIKNQLRLQIQKFMQLFSFRPSHLDGHNHVHVIPEIAELIAPALGESSIYRSRIPQEQLYEIAINPMNQVFKSNATQAKEIFERHKIVYPSNFIGLEQISRLNLANIERRIDSIIENDSRKEVSVQLMCHPGYPSLDQGDQFNRSKNRQIQLQALKSRQFLESILKKKQIKLSNFNQLCPCRQKQSRRRILLYSKMNSGSGNWTTSLRLQQMFQTLGYQVYIRSIQQGLNTHYETQSLRWFLTQFRITLIVGVNLARSGAIIYNATRSEQQIANKVPYLFIVAGTDANIYFNTAQAPIALKDSISDCSLLLSLSQSMLKLTYQFLGQKLHYKPHQKQVVLLGQSSNILAYELKQPEQIQNVCKYLLENYHLNVHEDRYIVFPASFRPVKDIQYLLTEFNNLINQHSDLRVVILGPILNQEYYQKCVPQLGRVQYLGTLQKQIYLELLKHAFFLVNTSISEGQCCSIQQGLQVGQICVVRNNQGNAELIKHNQTGYLYDTPQQFMVIFQTILKNQTQIIQKIKKNALEYHRLNFSIQSQANSYRHIFDKVLPSKQKLFTYPDVHAFSEVNSRLYSQVPQNILVKWFQDSSSQKRVIDLGCGSGIFGLTLVQKLPQKLCSQTRLELYDFNSSILSNTYYNCLQQVDKRLAHVRQIKIQVSDMFQNIQNCQKGNLYVANMPQTPFQFQHSRPDKNDGKDSLKFNEQLVRKFSQFNSKSILIMLYSFMSYPSKFFQILNQLDLQIKWKSQKINFQILSKSYDSMEQNLSNFLKNHIKAGRAEVEVKLNQNGEQIFFVPGQILVIQKNSMPLAKQQKIC